ncbi:LVIVD repeat-containing protein [Corallococcus terminator]
MRRFFLLSSTLVLALGCGKDDDSKNKAECHLAAINLSSCQRSTLATVQASGVWNVNVELNDGTGSAGAMSFAGSAGARMLGRAVTEQQFTDDTFYLAADEESFGRTVRYSFTGCSATAPTKVAGTFRRCVDGGLDLQGTFSAVRIVRNADEAESSGLELVKELKVPRGIARDLAVSGGYAYVPAGNEGIFIYDVRDPAAAEPVGAAKRDPHIYNDVVVRGTTLFAATQGIGLTLYNVEDPKNPVFLRALSDPAVDVTSLALEGNLLFAASPTPNGEVLVFDVTTPVQPKLVIRYFIEGAAPRSGEVPMDVTAVGNRLYVSNWSYGLTVSDFSTPSTPKLLGRFGGGTARTAAVGTVGDRILAFTGGEDWGAHLSVLDVASPANVLQVGEFRIRPEVSIRALALSGTKLYVAHYQDGLRVLDVSNPSFPKQVAYYNTWREADAGRGESFSEGLNSVSVPGDGYVYATESSRGLLIFREAP